MAKELLEGPGFTIEIEKRPGFLRALVRGPQDSAAVSLAYWRRLGEECLRRGADAVLVLEDLPPWPDAGPEVFEAVTNAMAESGFRHIRVAFVDLREEVEANEMGLLLGVERGLSLMMFSNEPEAEQWLRFGSPDASERRKSA